MKLLRKIAVRWLKAHCAYFALVVDDIQQGDFKLKCQVAQNKPLVMLYLPVTFLILALFSPPLAIVYAFLLAAPWGLRFALSHKHE